MRVIAGTLGGRHFAAPKGHRTHPMSEKARGGLFNSLGDVSGLRILDAFSGSGALAFEAISRGAAGAILIENDKTATKTIRENIHALGLEETCKVIGMGVSGWSDANTEIFDIVIADPPYDKLQLQAVAKLDKHIIDGGLLVVSWPSSHELAEINNLKIVEQKSYGDATLVFYRKIT